MQNNPTLNNIGNSDFAAIGKAIKQTSGAYQAMPDAAVGEAYVKKFYPSEYEKLTTQQSSNIQAGKEIYVQQQKNQLELGQQQSLQTQKQQLQQQQDEQLVSGILSTIKSLNDKKTLNYDTSQALLGKLNASQQAMVQAGLLKEGITLPVNPKGGDATAKKNQDSFNKTINFINTLEKNYQESGAGQTNAGPLTRVLGMGLGVEGALGLNKNANIYDRQKKGFAATLKTLTGDTGVLTEQDFKRLAGLVPDLGSTGPEAEGLFNDLRSQVAAAYGGKGAKTSFKGGNKGVIGTATDILIPSTKSYVNKVIKQREEVAKLNEKDPEAAIKLAQKYTKTSGSTLLDLITGEGQARSALPAALEVSSYATLPELIGGIFGGIKSGFNKIVGSRLTPQSILAQARSQAAKDLTLNTKQLIDAGDNYVKNVDPAAAKAWETLKPSIKEATSADDLLTKLTNWGDKAFTKSGDKRAITEGLLKSHLYGVGRNIISQQAPDVARITGQMAQRAGAENMLNKVVWPAAIGAGASAIPSLLLWKLLSGNKNQ